MIKNLDSSTLSPPSLVCHYTNNFSLKSCVSHYFRIRTNKVKRYQPLFEIEYMIAFISKSNKIRHGQGFFFQFLLLYFFLSFLLQFTIFYFVLTLLGLGFFEHLLPAGKGEAGRPAPMKTQILYGIVSKLGIIDIQPLMHLLNIFWLQ